MKRTGTARSVSAAHAAFVLTGAVTTLLGPILPVLTARWAITDASAGLLFTAQFAGSIAGTACSGLMVRRAGFGAALGAGLALMAAGTGVLPLSGWPGALLLVGTYGFGLGITIPATNLFVAAALPERRSEGLNILNLAWAAGAVASPPIFARLAARGAADAFLFGLSAALVLAMIGCVASIRSAPQIASTTQQQKPSNGSQVPWRSPAFWSFAAMFFIYVGTENALAGWVATYAQRIEVSTAAASMPTLFWGALMLGRAVAPLSLRLARERTLVLFWLSTAAAGTVLLLLSTTLAAVAVSTALCGFGLAAVFPTAIAQLSREVGDASGAPAAAVAFVCAGLGGAVLPWIVGAWSTAAGSLAPGFLVPLAGCVAMIVLRR